MSKILAALTELVALKKIKDRADSMLYTDTDNDGNRNRYQSVKAADKPHYDALMTEYMDRKDKAWQRAFEEAEAPRPIDDASLLPCPWCPSPTLPQWEVVIANKDGGKCACVALICPTCEAFQRLITEKGDVDVDNAKKTVREWWNARLRVDHSTQEAIVDVAKKTLHHIASCSPHVTDIGQPTERSCKLCLTFIDEARAVFNYEPWPAIAHTPKVEPCTESMMWLYTHCLALGMSRGSESGKMAHDIALFTMDQQEEIKKLKEEPLDSRITTIMDTFIISALKELGEETTFLLLPEQRLEKLKQIMLHIISTKKTT